MRFTQLGRSDLKVSSVCLGTVFRSELDEDACIAAIRAAEEMGCNYLDCANAYRDGFSEQVVGKAIRGRRDRFVISTKAGAPMPGEPATGGLSRVAIMSAIEHSLRRLGVDHVDCYLCHFPDERTPLDETLRALDDLVRQGKIRYPGCSRFESWRLCESLNLCATHGLAPLVCNQLGYSVLDRRIEQELLPYCARRGVAVTVFAATAIGLLSGRYRHGRPPPEGTSWHRGPYNFGAAMTPKAGDVIEAVLAIARERRATPTQVAMAWCLGHGAASVIIGADTAERVHENLLAGDLVLSGDEMARLDEVSEGHWLVVRKDCPDGWAASRADSGL